MVFSQQMHSPSGNTSLTPAVFRSQSKRANDRRVLTGTLARVFFAVILLAVNAHAHEANSAATSTKKKVWAVFSEENITIDGHLDEPVWKQAPAATDFTQKFPYEGERARENSEVYFLYDRDALYVGAVLYNSRTADLVTDELKRDFSPPQAGDLFVVLLDTFHDGRNCYAFETNPGGAIRELQSFDQGRFNRQNIFAISDLVWRPRLLVCNYRHDWF